VASEFSVQGNAIRYVLDNAAHHFGALGVDPFSSSAPEGRAVVARARSWLLTVGWRRARLAPRMREWMNRHAPAPEPKVRPGSIKPP
jgi:hypothetical protein